MRITSALGSVVVGVALAGAFAVPALADPPPPAPAPVVGGPCTAAGTNSGNLTCIDGKWTNSTTIAPTDTNKGNNNGQSQKADTDQKATGKNNNQQSCTQQQQVINGSGGTQVCINVNGNLVLAPAPASCTGTTCDATPAMVPAPAPCEANSQVTFNLNGKQLTWFCAKRSGQAVLVPSAKAAAESDSLPITGVNVGVMAFVAVGLLGAGGAMYLVSRRRRVMFTNS